MTGITLSMKSASRTETKSSASADAPLHILLLDPVYRTPAQPGATRSYDLARHFAQSGQRVSVLTTTAAAPEATDGITVTTVKAPHPARFGHPTPADLLARFAGALRWRVWGIKHVDVVLTADRPLNTLLLLWFCWLRGAQLVLDVREGLPDAAPPGAPLGARLGQWWSRAMFRLAARKATQIAVLSPEIEQALMTKGIGIAKTTLCPAGCDTALLTRGGDAPALPAHLAPGPLIVYAGHMSSADSLGRLLDLAAAAPSVSFVLAGDGSERGVLEARAHELGVLGKNVAFIDPLPRRELGALLAAATAVYVHDGAPRAFFDALAAGKPVIVAGNGGARDITESRGAGIGLPDDPAAAAREVIDYLRDEDGLRRARQQAAALAAGRFNLERVVASVRGLVEGAAAGAPRADVMRRRMLATKRFIDIVGSAAALIVLSPLLLVVMILARIKMGGPVVFTQSRPGLKGKAFNIYKLRTMTNARDAGGKPLSDAARLTAFGKFLRRASIDELPQLWNVLKGDMSLIGPRPLLHEYMPYYSAEQHRRHDVKPGLTGWAVVNGRNAISWEDKFKLDVYYVDNLSLALDFKIALKTIWVLISGQGVSSPGQATFERFDEIMARRQGAEDV